MSCAIGCSSEASSTEAGVGEASDAAGDAAARDGGDAAARDGGDATSDASDVGAGDDASEDARDTADAPGETDAPDGADAGGCPAGDGTFAVRSVEGTVADGATISVCGDRFGDLGPTILLFDDMESGQAGEAVPMDAPIIGEWLSGSTVYAADAARSGALSMVVADADINNGRGRSMVVGAPDPAESLGLGTFDEFFVSWAIRDLGDFPGHDSSPTEFSSDSSAKDVWVMYGARGDNYDYSCSRWECHGNDLVLMTHTGGGSFKTDGNNTASNWWHGDFWQFQAWNSMSMYMRIDQSDPYGASTGVLEHVSAQGGFVTESYGGQILRELDDLPTAWDRIKFGAWYRGAGDVRRVMDDLYVATGPGAAARVEIADAPQIEDATKVAVSTVDAWSDQRLEATVRLGHLDPDTDQLYLFVVNADNERTPGFALNP